MKSIFRILQFTRKYWAWYIFMGVFVIAISALSLVVPLIFKQIVDLLVLQLSGSPVEFSHFFVFLAAIILADVAITTLTAVGQWIGDLLTAKLTTYLSKQFYEHVLSLHIGYFDSELTGKIVNKMYRGITSITEFIQNMLNNFLPFFLTAFVTVGLLLYYSPVVGILLAVLFPAYILITHKSSQNWMIYENQKNKITDESQGRAFESLVGIRVVKSFSAQILELKTFLTARYKIESLTKTQTKHWHMYDFLRRFALNIILFAIYAYIIYWTFMKRYSLGEMTLLLQLVQQARFPLFAMSFILGQIQHASAGSSDYFSVLATPSTIVDTPNARHLTIGKLEKTKPLIQFSHVNFSYDSGKNVLKQVSFSIFPKEKFALVGESGEGKSTIVNLLLRFYEPESGTITISGQNIAELTQDSLHKHVAVVFQESLLFSGSIKENITYGNKDATEEEIIEAAKAANAHEFIKKLKDGYESTIGERGVKLSGGQKQRIAIARAILKNAPIIVLDEATSSLDSKAEREVQIGLNRLLNGRTAIIIAHRLSTIASADHILVLQYGKVAQYGTHDQLLKKKGLYAELVSLQREVLEATTKKDKSKKLQEFELVG